MRFFAYRTSGNLSFTHWEHKNIGAMCNNSVLYSSCIQHILFSASRASGPHPFGCAKARIEDSSLYSETRCGGANSNTVQRFVLSQIPPSNSTLIGALSIETEWKTHCISVCVCLCVVGGGCGMRHVCRIIANIELNKWPCESSNLMARLP